MKIYVLFLMLSLCCFLACEEAEVAPPDVYSCTLSFAAQSDQHPRNLEIQAALDELATQIPGVQVALRSPGGATWTGAAGMADIPGGITLEPCHRMMVGSISKVFTSVLILRLQDEGLLDIDDPLQDHIDPELIAEIENADQVTLREMLNHTSGLADYNNTRFTFDALNTPHLLLSAREKLAYAHGKSATHAPGEAYSYSNTNYVLLGLVVEQITGLSLPEALQEQIFTPLGLDRAQMGTVEQPIPQGTARPYIAFSEGRFQDFFQVEVSDAATGDGGIAINAQELTVFIRALFQGQLLFPESFQDMTQSPSPKPAGEADFEEWLDEASGLGIDRFQTTYGTAYGHTGRIFAYNALLFYFPDTDAALAIAYNASDFANESDPKQQLRNRLLELMFAP